MNETLPRTPNETKLLIFSWSLSAIVLALAIIVWLQGINWQLSAVTAYTLFPLLGIAAFSLMWAHYIVSIVRQYFKIDRAVIISFFEITSFMVLIMIMLHPGILIWQLWRDGLGLPPGSYLQNYVAPTMRLAVTVGSVSLFVFLAYEFRRKYSDRSWWKFVAFATDMAMVGIFYHSLTLGSHLKQGWFRTVWWFYGVTLLLALIKIYANKLSRPKVQPS